MLRASRYAWLLLLLAGCWTSKPVSEPLGQGYTPNPDGTRLFLQELDEPLFKDAGRDALEGAKGVDTFLYRAMYKAHLARYGRPWQVGNQGAVGSCVGWGFSQAAYCSLAVAWTQDEIPDPPLLTSPESCYAGSRVEARGKPEGGGGYSDGSYGGAAARWLNRWGVVFRDRVLDHDLTKYSESRCREWGRWGNGGEGDNGRLDAYAKRHPVHHVALVRTFDEAAAAIESGYPVAICSGVGYTTTRDALGYCRASGTWAHCMYAAGVRWKKNGSPDDALLIINSWGSYVDGGKWPDDQPDGSFWARRADVELMLSKWEDSFAVGAVQGFKYRDLSHREWLDHAR